MYKFEPQIKLKAIFHKTYKESPPVPPPLGEEKYIGYFTGLSVEVLDGKSMEALYDNGYYGKGSFSRGPPSLLTHRPSAAAGKETLVLSLEEAFLLTFIHRVMETRELNEQPLSWAQYIHLAEAVQPRFVDYMSCYLYMKAKGWVIKSGLKYGGDFLIYSHGPRYSHAAFVVFVIDPEERRLFELKNLKAIQRVAETCYKHVILLTVSKPDDLQLKDLDDFEEIGIAELVVDRVNLNALLNRNTTTKASQSKQK